MTGELTVEEVFNSFSDPAKHLLYTTISAKLRGHSFDGGLSIYRAMTQTQQTVFDYIVAQA